MYFSTILITFFVSAVSKATPIFPRNHLSRDEIQHFLQSRDRFMFDRKEDYQDVPLLGQTRHTRRNVDCSDYPGEVQDFCYLTYGDGDDYPDAPLNYDEIKGVDDVQSSQTGWNARRF